MSSNLNHLKSCQLAKEEKKRQANRERLRRWRQKHPEKRKEQARKANKKSLAKHPERNLKNNPKLQKKCTQGSINRIIREHDERHKNDPDALDIREFIEGTDMFQFRRD